MKILQKNEKILRQTAREILVRDIKTVRMKKILGEMSEALGSQSDGVAIAAPQIGYPLRIFMVSGKIFSKDFGVNKELPPATAETQKKGKANLLNKPVREKPPKDLVFINPVISKLSRKKEWVPEGCLSVRPLYGKTFRSMKATIAACDENGKKFQRGASGLLAQIFQHETDHLNGILFTDHAIDVKAEKPK